MAKWKSKGWARQEEDKVQAEAKSCQLYWLQGVGVVRFQIGWVLVPFNLFSATKQNPLLLTYFFIGGERGASKDHPRLFKLWFDSLASLVWLPFPSHGQNIVAHAPLLQRTYINLQIRPANFICPGLIIRIYSTKYHSKVKCYFLKFRQKFDMDVTIPDQSCLFYKFSKEHWFGLSLFLTFSPFWVRKYFLPPLLTPRISVFGVHYR